MLPRSLFPLLLLPLLACGAGNPTPPPMTSGELARTAEWSVDREALPGGSLRVLHVADSAGREAQIIDGGGRDLVQMPIYAYLFEHPTEGPVLIDTGYGRRTARDPFDYPGRTATNLLHMRMATGSAVADQLPDVGWTTDDVKHVVLTHMHSDHVGGLEDVPRSTLWVARAEWEAAAEPGFLGKPDTRPFEDHARVRTIDFIATSPYGPFSGHVDVFGDGSLILLPTPGHTVGHLSVLLNLKGRSFLFVGDSAWIDRHWQEVAPKGRLVRGLLEVDWQANQGALLRIRAWAQAFPDLTIVSGHEAGNLQRLKTWPEAYE
jgi:glyoxylase-like metal-dependent hydrolase (beta-lactamase superfamily II)